MRPDRGLILDWLIQARPSKRQVKLFVFVFALIMVAGSITAMAANAAEPLDCAASSSCEETQVMQPGELIPLGDKSEGGQKTLFETYNFGTWQLDSELTFPGDTVQIAFYGIAQFLMYLLLLVVYMTVGLTWWLFSAMSVPGLSDAADGLITSASGSLLQWIFPTAVVVGAVVAYVQGREAKGSYYNQVAWMVAAGVLAVGLTTDAGVFTNGIQNVRESGSSVILSTTGKAISADEANPFTWPAVDYDANTAEDAMLRKSADSTWRTLVATPWCVANFGSIEACQKYGPQILAEGTDFEARKDVIKDTIYASEGSTGDKGALESAENAGKDSPTGQWVKGEQWGQRLGIVALALIIALVFCGLMLVIGFSALAAIMLTYLLLVAGVFFAALWIIPGKPRQWGVAWGEALLGAVLVTFVSLLTFGVTLALLTALYTASASSGWFTSIGLGLVLLVTAFGFRKRLAEIVNAPSTGAGRAALIGAAVTKTVGKGLPQAGRSAVTAGKSTVRRANSARKGVVRGAQATGRGGAATFRAARRAPGDVRDVAKLTKEQAQYAGAAARSFAPARSEASQIAQAGRQAFVTRGGLRPGPRAVPRPSGQPRRAPQPRNPRPASSPGATSTATATSTRPQGSTPAPAARRAPQQTFRSPRHRPPAWMSTPERQPAPQPRQRPDMAPRTGKGGADRSGEKR